MLTVRRFIVIWMTMLVGSTFLSPGREALILHGFVLEQQPQQEFPMRWIRRPMVIVASSLRLGAWTHQPMERGLGPF